MQKINKTIMHVWISFVSLGAFVFSWALLVHSPKPAPLIAPEPRLAQAASTGLTRLELIPSLNDFLNSGSRQVQTPQSSTRVQPRLRTRGS
jgi:hypothetical protein